jgi:hypothetical protein
MPLDSYLLHVLTKLRDVYTPNRISLLEKVQDEILGPPQEIMSKKARFDKKASCYLGSLAFERTQNVIATRKGEQCYAIATTYHLEIGWGLVYLDRFYQLSTLRN